MEEIVNRPLIEQALESYGKEIEKLMKDYPCLSEVCKGLEVAAYPAALFVGGCFLGTLMTRCTYHYYYQRNLDRRLNYGIYIIGDPGTGKSFAGRLYNLIAGPIIQVSKEGMNAVNRYKRKYSEWEHGGQKGDGPKKPKALIRTHPARTSNKVLIEDMNNAIDIVDGEEMHLHLLSFDSELENTIRLQTESWNSKFFMELKAFHNEEDGECYVGGNLQPNFNVYWNYVYTGTPMALEHKVNQRNIGTGLATRLAAIPMPSSHFKMLNREEFDGEYQEPEEDKTLRMWAERLDKEYGELPIRDLVEECYEWTKRRMEDAKDDESRVDELICKRVGYYGVNVSVPFIMMRHWDEWKEHRTLTIDDTDRWFCQLICKIQFSCQHHFFGRYWESYFNEQRLFGMNAPLKKKRYRKEMKQRYCLLADTFTTSDVIEQCHVSRSNAEKMIRRWKDEGYIVSEKRGVYQKVYYSLM